MYVSANELSCIDTPFFFSQSAGAVEYTDCISTEG